MAASIDAPAEGSTLLLLLFQTVLETVYHLVLLRQLLLELSDVLLVDQAALLFSSQLLLQFKILSCQVLAGLLQLGAEHGCHPHLVLEILHLLSQELDIIQVLLPLVYELLHLPLLLVELCEFVAKRDHLVL